MYIHLYIVCICIHKIIYNNCSKIFYFSLYVTCLSNKTIIGKVLIVFYLQYMYLMRI